MTTFAELKHPDDVVALTIDWSDTLNGFSPNDTIASSTWAVDAGDVVIDSDTNGTTTAAATVSGGTNYSYAQITNQITTAAALVFNRSITISVQTR